MRVIVTIVGARASGKTHLGQYMARSLKRYRNPQMEFEIQTQLGPGARKVREQRGRGAPWGRG